jgi:murein tripeptide amidase MpaA
VNPVPDNYLVNSVPAGIHAREWIAPAVATYMIRELVENFWKHEDILCNVNHHFLPVANPDGYAYSHTHDDVGKSLNV